MDSFGSSYCVMAIGFYRGRWRQLNPCVAGNCGCGAVDSAFHRPTRSSLDLAQKTKYPRYLGITSLGNEDIFISRGYLEVSEVP